MQIRSTTLAVLALTISSGCGPGYYTQAGLVPAPRAMPYDGQPIEGSRVEGRHTTIVEPVDPDGDPDSGAYVASHHTGVALRHGRTGTEVGVEVDVAWASGASPTAEGIEPPPDGIGAWSLVFGARHSIVLSDQLRLGVGSSVGVVRVPIRLDGGPTETDDAATFQLALVPSWRSGPVTAFAGVTLAGEIRVPRSLGPGSTEPNASGDRSAVVLSAGTSIALDGGTHLTLQLAQPMGSDLTDDLQLDLRLGFDFGGSRPAHRAVGDAEDATP
jgi:hypothetical protein